MEAGFRVMSDQPKRSSDSSDSPVPWILPRSYRGIPTGYRAVVVVGVFIAIVALPYGIWTYLFVIAGLAAISHQAVIDKRAAAKRAEARNRWRDSD